MWARGDVDKKTSLWLLYAAPHTGLWVTWGTGPISHVNPLPCPAGCINKTAHWLIRVEPQLRPAHQMGFYFPYPMFPQLFQALIKSLCLQMVISVARVLHPPAPTNPKHRTNPEHRKRIIKDVMLRGISRRENPDRPFFLGRPRRCPRKSHGGSEMPGVS